MNGQHPVRVQLVPMDRPFITGTGIAEKGRRPVNVLHELYTETMARCPAGGLVAHTARLVESGALTGHAAVRVSRVARPRASVKEASTNLPSGTLPAKPSMLDLPAEQAVAWLRACMDARVDVALVGVDNMPSVQLNRHQPTAVNGEATANPLFVAGLVTLNLTRLDARFTEKAMTAMTPALREEVADYIEARPLLTWLSLNARHISGTPEHQAHADEAAVGAVTPLSSLDARVEDGVLFIRRSYTREAFGSALSTLYPSTRRIGSNDYDVFPISSLAELAQAIREAKDAQPPQDKLSRRQQKADKRSKAISMEPLPGLGGQATEDSHAP